MKRTCLKLSGYTIYLYVIFLIGSFLEADSDKNKTLVAVKTPVNIVNAVQANNSNFFGSGITMQAGPQDDIANLYNAVKIVVIKGKANTWF